MEEKAAQTKKKKIQQQKMIENEVKFMNKMLKVSPDGQQDLDDLQFVEDDFLNDHKHCEDEDDASYTLVDDVTAVPSSVLPSQLKSTPGTSQSLTSCSSITASSTSSKQRGKSSVLDLTGILDNKLSDSIAEASNFENQKQKRMLDQAIMDKEHNRKLDEERLQIEKKRLEMDMAVASLFRYSQNTVLLQRPSFDIHHFFYEFLGIEMIK
jgi:hypothetical protein